MSVPVVLAAPGLPGETDLVAALGRPGAAMTVVRRCVDALDLVGAAASGCAHAAVVSPSLPRLARDTIARLRDSQVGVLGVVAPGDDIGERWLRDLDVPDVVVLRPDDLGQSIGRLALALQERPPMVGERVDEVEPSVPPASGGNQHVRLEPPRGPDVEIPSSHAESPEGVAPGRLAPGKLTPGKLVVVWGPHGAPGCTSVAITLSHEIALAGEESWLIDADTLGGSVALALGVLDEASGIAVACRHADAGTLDALTLAQAARSLDEGWRVVTGISRAPRWVELRPASLTRLWQVARDIPGITVVDIGCGLDAAQPGWSGAADRFAAGRTALELADQVIAVGSADPVGVDRLIDGLDLLRQHRDDTPLVVVNRVRRGPLGRDPQGQITQALARHAGVSDPVLIDDDPASFDAALREGRTLAEVAGRSQARAVMTDLARDVLQGLDSAVTA